MSLRFVQRIWCACALLAFLFGGVATAWADVDPASGPPAPTASPEAAKPGLEPPKVRQRVDAEYPAGSPSSVAIEVGLRVDVDADGKVGKVEVVDSGGAPFDEAAVAAVQKWAFEPAKQDGVAIASRLRLTLHFAPQRVPSPPPIVPAKPEVPPPPPAPADPPAEPREDYKSHVRGDRLPSRGASDFRINVGALGAVPRASATELLRLAPGVLLTNEGGESHAEQIYLRGFDARLGQDLEMSVDGAPINEAGNLHGNGYADAHFIIPETVRSLRVVEGAYDPRQGNFAVAGSLDYRLGIDDKGLSVKYTTGSFGTHRLLLMWGLGPSSPGTFAAVELYQTNGYGQNRSGRRATLYAQYEKVMGQHTLRANVTGYIASFRSPNPIREDDYRAGRVGFYDTYDPGPNFDDDGPSVDAQRYSATVSLDSHVGRLELHNQLFGIVRPLRLRENFTGFITDDLKAWQSPHAQRGDLLEMRHMGYTVGARGSARLSGRVLGQLQAIELGYFLRGDFTHGTQKRMKASNGDPYKTEADIEARLGDVGLYADLDLHPLRWLTLRGGLRADLFVYDVLDNCAVQSVRRPSADRPPGDASCFDQAQFGVYREPQQTASAVGAAWLPRASLILGPWKGLSASGAVGQGVRSIDPIYIANGTQTPFANALSYEGGLTYDLDNRYVHLNVHAVGFQTRVERDLIFSETVGRAILGGATTRSGSANSVRLTGRFFDIAANVTWVRAIFQDTGLLIPYIPEVVVRADAALFGELPWKRFQLAGHRFFAQATTSLSYVSPRPLPYGERGDSIFTMDASASLRWWFVEVGVQGQNIFNRKYRLAEFNYASDFRSEPQPTLVPVRHFIAGPPLSAFFFVRLTYGGRS